MPARQGIVCLANDRVYDFLVAMVASVRRHTDLPLAIIPFDERTSATRAFAARQRIEMLDHPGLEEFDDLGRRIWPGRVAAPHTFRKLVAFDGPFERFLFLDADVVLLRDVAWLLEAHERQAPEALWCFDTGDGQAYRPGPLREAMVSSGFPGVSTGLFIARRGLITHVDAQGVADDAVAARDEFLELADQPFINFLLQRRGIKVAKVGDLFDDVAGTTWAGARLARSGGRLVVDEPRWSEHHGQAPAALHWSGSVPGPRMPHRKVFVDYRRGDGGKVAHAWASARLLPLPVGRLPRKVRSAVGVVAGRRRGAWL